MQLGRLVARTVLGSLFVGHGAQKLFGSFGGPGLAGTDAMMESLELRPARVNSLAAGVTETLGGAMLVAGLGTPVAAAGLMGTMLTAIEKVHLPQGLWNSSGGYEYNLALIASLFLIVDEGPGDLSVDAALGREVSGPRWALTALAAAAAGSALVSTMGKRFTPAAENA
jgi:putative oxidoreductase